jgi:hypothetical protein
MWPDFTTFSREPSAKPTLAQIKGAEPQVRFGQPYTGRSTMIHPAPPPRAVLAAPQPCKDCPQTPWAEGKAGFKGKGDPEAKSRVRPTTTV